MTTALKRRRGTTAQHATFTGLEGEVTVDTDKETLVVHDGATAGGHPLAKENNTALTGNVTVTTNSSSTALSVTQTGTGAAIYTYRNDATEDAQVTIEQDGSGSSTLAFLQTGTWNWMTGHYGSDNTYRISGSGVSLNTSNFFKIAIDGATTHTANSTSPALLITQDGTGNALEVRDVTSDSTPFVVDASGKVGIGRAPTSEFDVYKTSDTTVVAQVANPNAGTSAACDLRASNGTAYAGIRQFGTAHPSAANQAWLYTAGAHTLCLATSFVQRVAITSAGLVTANNSVGLGYGTGSGGTVTQATSKSTSVTLNKPSGQITMHNAALAAGASVEFALNSTSLDSAGVDGLIVHGNWVSVDPSAYHIEVSKRGPGYAYIRVTNISGSSAADALVLTFNIIKGSTS